MARVWCGAVVEVPVRLQARGNENALGFSVSFDPSRLQFRGTTPGADAPDVMMQANTNYATQGQLGFALAKSIGQSLTSGPVEIVRLRFVAGGAPGTATVDFDDHPVYRELVNVTAAIQPMTCSGAAVQLVRAARFQSWDQQSGTMQMTLSGEDGERCVVEASSDLRAWTPIATNTVSGGWFQVQELGVGSDPQRFYRVRPQP